jgi:hypothetical protein
MTIGMTMAGACRPYLPAKSNPRDASAPTWLALTQGLARTIPRVARHAVMPLRAWPGQTTRYLTEVLMKRLAITAAALAALALPSLAQAQTPPLPPGEPPASGPPPGLPSLPAEPPAAPGVVPPASPETTPALPADVAIPAGPVDKAQDAAPAHQALKPAGKVVSVRLKGRLLVVKVACTADVRAKLRLTSGKVSIGQRRYQCRGTRTLKLLAPGAVVRRAHREGGTDVRARISATGFESNLVRVRVRAGSIARASAVARASTNYTPCGWCTELVFGGFGNTQTLEYWVRNSGDRWYGWNGASYWSGDAQYYQNYASAYITTYRYWYKLNGSTWEYYTYQNLGP